MQQAIGLCDMA